jgi:hypothetical protein
MTYPGTTKPLMTYPGMTYPGKTYPGMTKNATKQKKDQGWNNKALKVTRPGYG